jgi:uncharacterized C2H2 Zn-finger protein
VKAIVIQFLKTHYDNTMSQRECPICHYTFLKKKDFIDHVTYSSCAEKLQDLLVLCPHCNKQFPDNDSLSYHLMRSEACANQQDKAFDILNSLPRSHVNHTRPSQSKQCNDTSVTSKKPTEEDRALHRHYDSTDLFHVEQGIIVNTSNDIFDNQQDSSGTMRKKSKIFVPLEQIQFKDRPYFSVDTIHHTQAWRHMSSRD